MTTFHGLTRAELHEMLLHHETAMLSNLKDWHGGNRRSSVKDAAIGDAAIATALRNILDDEAKEAAKDPETGKRFMAEQHALREVKPLTAGVHWHTVAGVQQMAQWKVIVYESGLNLTVTDSVKGFLDPTGENLEKVIAPGARHQLNIANACGMLYVMCVLEVEFAP